MKLQAVSGGLCLGLALIAFVAIAPAASAQGTGNMLLVSGRWDNTVLAIDLARAMDPANDGTANAIVNRVRVTPDIDHAPGNHGPASGQPVNVVLSPDGRLAYVVNHSGPATNAGTQANQHGHPGLVTVLNVARVLDPAQNGTLGAVEAMIPTGGHGPVGFAITPDGRHALVSNSEGNGSEDGGRTIAVIDLSTRQVLRQVTQAWGNPGFPCPPSPIANAGPHPSFGCFADTNGIVISPLRGGLAFTANGGTDDVSVIDVQRAIAGDAGAEIARVPVAVGPWGIAVSPDGRLVATGNRESARTGAEGNTISLIDVEKAAAGARDAEVARVLVGTNNPATASRPFGLAFTPDGQTLIVTNFRANNVSFIDVRRALAGELGAETARVALETPSGGPSRPRGIVITPDGRYAAITGAARGQPGSGVLWVMDLQSRRAVSRVTGVGNETYLLALLARR